MAEVYPRRVANSPLDIEDVLRLRAAARRGMPVPVLAHHFQVSGRTVQRIVRGDTWGWVQGDSTGTE